jgi:hypothetical protein
MRPHRIIIEPLPRGCYRASYHGEVIVARSREPEFDACRVLLGRGISGAAETWHPGAAHPAMRLDIEKAAEATVVETPAGPRLAKWKPFRGIGDEASLPRRRGVVHAGFGSGALPT